MQTECSVCGHPTAPFANPGACTRASHRGDNQVRETGRSERCRGGIGVGGGNGDGHEVRDGDGDGAGTGTAVEANEKAQNGNEGGSGDEAGTGTRVETLGRTKDGSGDESGNENESRSGDGNGDEGGNGNGDEDRIGEGGREAKKRKKPHKSCRRHMGKGGDLKENEKM